VPVSDAVQIAESRRNARLGTKEEIFMTTDT
jgi:hypothetical protein